MLFTRSKIVIACTLATGLALSACSKSNNDEEKQCLDELLETQDPVLFDWILGMTPVPERYHSLINKLRLAHE